MKVWQKIDWQIIWFRYARKSGKKQEVYRLNSFQQFKLLPFMVDALTEKRITKPTDIQARIIPAALNGRDIIGKSQTGTGKTLAFLLPIVEAINPEDASVQAIVVAPTRELAW